MVVAIQNRHTLMLYGAAPNDMQDFERSGAAGGSIILITIKVTKVFA
jgi:hypothetical protein